MSANYEDLKAKMEQAEQDGCAVADLQNAIDLAMRQYEEANSRASGDQLGADFALFAGTVQNAALAKQAVTVLPAPGKTQSRLVSLPKPEAIKAALKRQCNLVLKHREESSEAEGVRVEAQTRFRAKLQELVRRFLNRCGSIKLFKRKPVIVSQNCSGSFIQTAKDDALCLPPKHGC